MHELKPGRARLARIDNDDGSPSWGMQLASGMDAHSGELLVFLRAGAFVLAISPEGAELLARGLVEEARIVRAGNNAG